MTIGLIGQKPGHPQGWKGLSTDDKSNIESEARVGDPFYETDTNNLLRFNGVSFSQIGTNGVGYSIPLPTSPSSVFALEALSGGSHRTVDVDANSLYKINPEIDTFYKISTGSSLYGTTSIYGGAGASPGWEFGSASLAGSNLDLGTGNFTMEFHAILPLTMTQTAHTIYTIGNTAGNGAQIRLQQERTGTDSYKLVLIHLDDAGADCGAGGASVLMSGVTLDNTVDKHIAIAVVRDGASSTITYTIDGVQTGQNAYTDTGVACDLSSATGRAGFGINQSGTNHGADATMYDMKVYTTDLSLSQINARVDALGPAYHVIDTADPFLKYWVHNQNGTDWAHESGYGSLTYTAENGAVVALASGGASATVLTSDVIWAKESIIVSTETSTFLNLYSQSGNSGDVRVIKL